MSLAPSRLKADSATAAVGMRHHVASVAGLLDPFAKHEAVTVGRSQPHFPPPPRLVRRGFQDLSSLRNRACVVFVDVLNGQVRNVTVVTEGRRRKDIGATTQHECHGSRSAERPVAWVRVSPLAAEHASEPSSGLVQIMDGKNRVRTQDLHRVSVPRDRRTLRRARI